MGDHWNVILLSAPEQAPLAIRLARRRKPSAFGYLSRHTAALPEDQRGVAISTLGKVIKRGWDWLGVTSLQSERINGLIEVPDLAASLTLNKGDFIRTGTRGAVYLAYRKAIQEAVSRQLEAWGDGRAETPEASSRMMRPLERDLDRVLEELSDDFPLLGSLVERRAGGQKRLPIDGKTTDIAAGTEAFAVLATPSTAEYRSQMRLNRLSRKHPLHLLTRTLQCPSLRRPQSLLQHLPCSRVMDVPVLRCGTGWGFSSRTIPITQNWAGSSSPPSGSTKPIPPIGARWHPAPWVITFRSPSRSHWPR